MKRLKSSLGKSPQAQLWPQMLNQYLLRVPAQQMLIVLLTAERQMACPYQQAGKNGILWRNQMQNASVCNLQSSRRHTPSLCALNRKLDPLNGKKVVCY